MRFTISILVLVFSTSIFSVYAAEASNPRQRVEATSELLFAISAQPESDLSEQRYFETETQKILSKIVDYGAITRGVYGKENREKLSADQDRRFQIEFERTMVQLVATALVGLEISETIVHEARMSKDTRAQVPVVVITADHQTFEFLFSLASEEGNWRVRNLIVNGVNLGLTYRNQFSELMKTHGEDIDAVIAAWSESVVEAGPDQV